MQVGTRLGVWIDRISRILIVIEIIAPMQKSFYVILVHLHTNGTVAPGGHRDISVGNLQRLAYTVVGPQILYTCIKEGLYVVVCGYRMVEHSRLVEVQTLFHLLLHLQAIQVGRLFREGIQAGGNGTLVRQIA